MPVSVPTVTEAASVPTWDEHAALAARVAALEGAAAPDPDTDPEPDPEPEEPTNTVPTNVTATVDEEEGTILLSWDAVAGADGYRIYGDQTPPEPELLGTTDETESLRGPFSDVTYGYWITAMVDGEESALSAFVVATVGGDQDDDEPAEGDDDEEDVDQAPGELLAAVPFTDSDLTGLMEGDSGIRQWSSSGDNQFGLVQIDGEPWGRASIEGGPHGDSIRAEGMVAKLGRPRDKFKIRHGDDLWFGVTILVEDGTPDSEWNTILQWKNDGTGTPPLELTLADGAVELGGGDSSFHKRLGAIDHDEPHRYVFHFVGGTAGKGWVEAWRDGVKVLARYAPPKGTMYGGLESYPKIGYYRDGDTDEDGAVCFSDYRIGTTYASVA